MGAMVEYKIDDVLAAAQGRVRRVFDEFDNVVVSVSSGKDSTVLFHLALEEAKTRGRKIKIFFLDQEAEYQSTRVLIDQMMRNDHVVPMWYQVPLLLTNATSHTEYFLDAWHEGREWLHPRSDLAIQSIDGAYPNRFYKFFEWFERQFDEDTAVMVGLRSKESLMRFRSVTNNPGYDGISWSTKTKSKQTFRFYPIYDWTFADVWKYISDRGVSYNRYYDRKFVKSGANARTMRVSNLIHEKSFHALAELQEFEPDTYERLLKRLDGVHCAALYANDDLVYSSKKLPNHFQSWVQYRNYLMASTPIDRIGNFRDRFDKQSSDEKTAQQQVKQILLNDWENNLPVTTFNRERLYNSWWDKL